MSDTGTPADSWSSRVFGGFRKTSERLTENLAGIVSKSRLDDAQLDEMVVAFIGQVGPPGVEHLDPATAIQKAIEHFAAFLG